MVFTAAQTAAFFLDPDQMSLMPETRAQLQTEGLAQVGDLTEFDEDSFKQLTNNLKKPGGTIPDPAPGAAPGAMIPTPPFVLGAKSHLCLKAAVNIAKYYQTTGRDLTAANMRWNPVIKEFVQHWKSLEERKDGDAPDVPKITKSLPVMKWAEAFSDFLQCVVGSRMISLSYVAHQNEEVPFEAPALEPQKPYSTEHGSVEEELIARASHTHANFRDDNASLYYYLEEATQGTAYAASIKPYQRARNGCGAWIALTVQYAGKDKWEAELKKQVDLLHTRKWKGQTNFSLDRFVAQHRNAHVSMVQCAEHVQFQLPNEYTRVGYLLDSIESKEPELQAAMALVRNDTAPTGKRNNFEDAAAFLLPHDPVSKKRSAAKCSNADISSADAGGRTHLKSGTGDSGVELRFHTYHEYQKLSPEQKSELHEWQKCNDYQKSNKKKTTNAAKKGDSKKPSDTKKVSFKKMVSEAVATKVASLTKAQAKEDEQKEAADAGAYLLSVLEAAAAKSTATTKTVASTSGGAVTKSPAISLQSILKKRSNQQS